MRFKEIKATPYQIEQFQIELGLLFAGNLDSRCDKAFLIETCKDHRNEMMEFIDKKCAAALEVIGSSNEDVKDAKSFGNTLERGHLFNFLGFCKAFFYREFESAIHDLETAIQCQCVDAIVNRAQMQEWGYGTADGEVDYPRAIAGYEEAADRGSSDAMVNRGLICERGLNTADGRSDFSGADVWYERAAFVENARAMFHRGLLFHEGRTHDNKYDYPQAILWYEKAVVLKYVPAMIALARMYTNEAALKEINLECDYPRAIVLCNDAELLGSLDAGISTNQIHNYLTAYDVQARLVDLLWDRLLQNQPITEVLSSMLRFNHALWPKLKEIADIQQLKVLTSGKHVIYKMLDDIVYTNVKGHIQGLLRQRDMLLLGVGLKTRNASSLKEHFSASPMYDAQVLPFILGFMHGFELPKKPAPATAVTALVMAAQDKKAVVSSSSPISAVAKDAKDEKKDEKCSVPSISLTAYNPLN